MNSKDPKDFVANYELNSYRYSDFWSGREYEHKAEVYLLDRLLKTYIPDLESRTIMDLGGAYGRLTFLYEQKAWEIILADYSTSELLEGAGRMVQSPYKDKTKFLALNAYKLPLKDNSLDSLLSVRVMHHLKDIDLFWDDLERVLAPGGVAVIEFANKSHILAILRHFFRFNLLSYLRKPVAQVEHKQSSQGMREGQVSIMYNFAPKYIRELSVQKGLEVRGMFACSFLRLGFLKRLFTIEQLLKVETYLQKVLPSLLITPSVFVVLRKPGDFIPKFDSVQQLICCPICKEEVKENKGTYRCKNKHTFEQTKVGIVDLRDPRPDEVTF